MKKLLKKVILCLVSIFAFVPLSSFNVLGIEDNRIEN